MPAFLLKPCLFSIFGRGSPSEQAQSPSELTFWKGEGVFTNNKLSRGRLFEKATLEGEVRTRETAGVGLACLRF